jgi:hypothetical protein
MTCSIRWKKKDAHNTQEKQGMAIVKRSMLHDRRGDWIQLILVPFFFLLLIVAIILMISESDRLHTIRPEMEKDLQRQYADTLLVSLMRTNVGQGNRMMVADLIIQSQNGLKSDHSEGEHHKELLEALQPLLADRFISLKIEYPDQDTFIVSNIEYIKKFYTDNPGLLPSGASLQETRLLLPGKSGSITVTLELMALAKGTMLVVNKPQPLEAIIGAPSTMIGSVFDEKRSYEQNIDIAKGVIP